MTDPKPVKECEDSGALLDAILDKAIADNDESYLLLEEAQDELEEVVGKHSAAMVEKKKITMTVCGRFVGKLALEG